MNPAIFQNEEINLDSLPKVEEVQIIRPQRNFLKVSLLSNTIFILVLASIAYFLLQNFPEYLYDKVNILIGAIILIALYSFILIFIGFKMRGYSLRKNDIIYKKGVFFQNLITIPFNRVQHCEIRQGPIERLFDLKTLLIYTAGGQSSDLSINGLEPEEALQLKDFIVASTLNSENEEE